uniref:Neur_chan_LBD domain-containing protein n=1 Tax=Enterobius vermicularis TaxID=51028 RepID=A0A0N4UUP7_ENTVE
LTTYIFFFISWIILEVLIFLLLYISANYASDEEYRLLRDLRKNYDPYERPVSNSSLPLNVTMKLYLQQILDVDEKNQVVTLVAWLEYQWNDYKLRWDPTEYGNINSVRIPGASNSIWKPDILLYNSADENFDTSYPVNFVVSYDGSVLQVPPGILKLSCKIDITWFPFDDQWCYLKFGSWTYSGRFIELQVAKANENDSKNDMDLHYYVQNGEWNLLGTPAYVVRSVFDDEPYISIFFNIIIQRRTLYYGLNLIIPSLLISLMTVLGFTLPPDAGEKITLEITILLSICFFLSMVAEMTPPTSEAVPLIGNFAYITINYSIVLSSFFLEHRKLTFEDLRKWLLHWLPWILMMRRPGVTSFSYESIKNLNKEEKQAKNPFEGVQIGNFESSNGTTLMK